jgi:hypothetical protein
MSETVVNALLCPLCDHYVYSCAGHDYRYCPCNSVAIDDGPNGTYFKISCKQGINLSELKKVKLVIPHSKQELYDDWNYSFKKRKFGHVPVGEAMRQVENVDE